MNSSRVDEYLEKYSVAPSPSRDYYGIKVLRDQVILYIWKISHGPHTNPIVRISRFGDFNQDKTTQNEIERVFGEPMFRYVRSIAQGNYFSLVTLPKHLVKKLTTYLPFKDVLKLSTLSRMTNEVFGGDVVWEVLYKRRKMGPIYRDEKEQASYYGWKRLFKEREMQKPARERKIKKLSSDQQPAAPRSSEKLKKKTTDFTPAKYQRETRSVTKVIESGPETPKSIGSRSNHSFSGRPNTASRKKPDPVIKGCKLFGTKKVTGDVEPFPKTEIFKIPVSSREVEIKKQLEPKKNASTISKSKNKTTSKIVPENCEEKTSTDKISTISGINDGKNRDKKAQSSTKKFANFGGKSDPSSARRISTKAASNTDELSTQLGQTTSAIIKKKSEGSKSSGKSVITKTKDENCGVSGTEVFGLEGLIRASIAGKYLSSETLMLPERSSSKKCSKASICSDENRSAIYRKFSSPGKPDAETMASELIPKAKKPDIHARKFSKIKEYLKRGDKHFCSKEPELRVCESDQGVKFSGVKKPVNNTTTKDETRSFPKTGSSDNLDPKFAAIESSQRLRPKKFTSLKK